MKTLLTVIGTRPEAIKLSPILKLLTNHKSFTSKVCITKQHTDLLDPLLNNLCIEFDFQFNICKDVKTLHQSAANILSQFGNLLQEERPDLVIVQGDTTTAFIAALAAFYAQIPIAHIEAGLRTGNLNSPWPEEAHRILIDKIATYFFVPNLQAKRTLLSEGIADQNIWVVGNTSIDALRIVNQSTVLTNNSKSPFIIFTVHRRENQGEPLKEICLAITVLAQQYSNITIKVLIHPNPAIRALIIGMLAGIKNVELLEPMDHHCFIHLLRESLFVATDSGGIQEEAPFIGKPLLILRDTTERPEGINAGTACLIGTNANSIIAKCQELLCQPDILAKMSKVHFPYGDGYAAERIVKILDHTLRGVEVANAEFYYE
jgi:UDP-N-acetylglucosamine 2-epimerase (non-hydrolysing)